MYKVGQNNSLFEFGTWTRQMWGLYRYKLIISGVEILKFWFSPAFNVSVCCYVLVNITLYLEDINNCYNHCKVIYVAFKSLKIMRIFSTSGFSIKFRYNTPWAYFCSNMAILVGLLEGLNIGRNFVLVQIRILHGKTLQSSNEHHATLRIL